MKRRRCRVRCGELAKRDPFGYKGSRYVNPQPQRRGFVLWDTRRTRLLAAGALLFLLAAPSAAAPTATALVVTTTADRENGDVATVSGLHARPGPDGISLREAIEATNNDPGEYAIGFAAALRGKSILVRETMLPPLTGGGVTIEGWGVTLRTTVRQEWGLVIASSGNRLHGLALEGFDIGVVIQPWKPGRGLPTRVTLADNVVSGLVMRRIGNAGIFVRSAWSPACGVPRPRPCRSFDRFLDTTIADNTIEARDTGVKLALYNSGDRAERLTVTGNSIRISERTDAGIEVEVGGDAGDDGTPARISDVLIARNSVEGSAGAGISVGSGVQRAQGNLTQRVRVLDNRVRLVRRGGGFCCQGIRVQAGSEAPDGIFPEVRPLRYPDRNTIRDVEVRGNSVSGTLEWGVSVSAGLGAGGSRNRAEGVRIVDNTVSSTVAGGKSVYVVIDNGEPIGQRYAVANRIAKVTIASNRISVPGKPGGYRPAEAGAIVLLGGGGFSRDGSIRNVTIVSNRIATSEAGIKVVGGIGGSATRGNSVTCVRISSNRVTGARTAVSVISNAEYASGNRASLGC